MLILTSDPQNNVFNFLFKGDKTFKKGLKAEVLKKDGIEIEYNELVSLKTKFILVYNFDKNILKEKGENINQGFLKETIQFTNIKKFLFKYKGILYDEVHLINPEVFIKNFIEK